MKKFSINIDEKLKKKLIAVGIVIFIALLLCLTVVGLYNEIEFKYEKVSSQEDIISELINQSLDSVEDIHTLYNNLGFSENVALKKDIEDTKNIKTFIIKKDKYEVLKTDIEDFLEKAKNPVLQKEELYRENINKYEYLIKKLDVAKKEYQDTIDAYNKTIETFPTNIVANVFRFSKHN